MDFWNPKRWRGGKKRNGLSGSHPRADAWGSSEPNPFSEMANRRSPSSIETAGTYPKSRFAAAMSYQWLVDS